MPLQAVVIRFRNSLLLPRYELPDPYGTVAMNSADIIVEQFTVSDRVSEALVHSSGTVCASVKISASTVYAPGRPNRELFAAPFTVLAPPGTIAYYV